MLNLESINTIYLACGATDLRRGIDGLCIIVETELKLNPFDKALFIFCNKQMDRLKILHFDEGFWLYFFRLEHKRFKWPSNQTEALCINREELKWFLKGYELRINSKFPKITERKFY